MDGKMTGANLQLNPSTLHGLQAAKVPSRSSSIVPENSNQHNSTTMTIRSSSEQAADSSSGARTFNLIKCGKLPMRSSISLREAFRSKAYPESCV